MGGPLRRGNREVVAGCARLRPVVRVVGGREFARAAGPVLSLHAGQGQIRPILLGLPRLRALASGVLPSPPDGLRGEVVGRAGCQREAAPMATGWRRSSRTKAATSPLSRLTRSWKPTATF